MNDFNLDGLLRDNLSFSPVTLSPSAEDVIVIAVDTHLCLYFYIEKGIAPIFTNDYLIDNHWWFQSHYPITFYIYRTRVPRQYAGSTIYHRNGIWLIKPLWFKTITINYPYLWLSKVSLTLLTKYNDSDNIKLYLPQYNTIYHWL